MSNEWQLQEAKNRLSEVVEDALNEGPQIITRRGIQAVVVLSYAEYRRLQASQTSLTEFFRTSPLVGLDIDLSRDSSPLRDVLEL
ncbi:MAG: type II toxin-antitoxin system Phd/YefM family antitoxin [Rhodothermales bacterium]|nr:type II toxin-antitoxin system Phd/YefM family antitoxin [Rhodothermales bacterium]